LGFNALVLTQEIFDDFGASLTCFSVGYFKQTQALLRNSVESVFQLWKNKYESKYGNISDDPWIQGIKGIEKIEDISKQIESFNSTIPGIKLQIRNLNKLYGRLCMSTHSHKSRMNSINSPRQESTLASLVFEPLEFLYTKRTYIYTLNLVLKLLLCYFESQKETDWKLPIINILKEEIARLNKSYSIHISNYEKGFLIFRESLKITKDKIVQMYSIDLNKDLKELTRRKTKLNQAEQKLFRDAVFKRIQSDK
jgi:hypothetical protein